MSYIRVRVISIKFLADVLDAFIRTVSGQNVRFHPAWAMHKLLCHWPSSSILESSLSDTLFWFSFHTIFSFFLLIIFSDFKIHIFFEEYEHLGNTVKFRGEIKIVQNFITHRYTKILTMVIFFQFKKSFFLTKFNHMYGLVSFSFFLPAGLFIVARGLQSACAQ